MDKKEILILAIIVFSMMVAFDTAISDKAANDTYKTINVSLSE